MGSNPTGRAKNTMKKNQSGDIRISVKYIHEDNYIHLIESAKKQNLSETAVLNQALKLHKEKYPDK